MGLKVLNGAERTHVYTALYLQVHTMMTHKRVVSSECVKPEANTVYSKLWASLSYPSKPEFQEFLIVSEVGYSFVGKKSPTSSFEFKNFTVINIFLFIAIAFGIV